MSAARRSFARIAVDLDGATLEEALTTITRQAGLTLAYSKAIVPLDRRVQLKAENITVAAALTEVLLDANVDVLFTTSGQAVLVPQTAARAVPSQVGSLIGRVTDKNNGQPIAAAQVSVDGTTLGRTTNEDGRYSIPNVASGSQQVTARRIGYEAQTQRIDIPDGGSANLDFALAPSATNLAQMVVTGTAGNQARAAQSAVVASINATDVLSRAPITNVSEVLQARVPGVTVTTGSGVLGAASQISIRGIASLALSNNPLVFIDGVRANSKENMGEQVVNRGMGGWLVRRFRPELYTVGLFMYHGKAANSRRIYDVTPVDSGSLEAILHTASAPNMFLDLSRAKRSPATEWMYMPIIDKSWGRSRQTEVIRDQFDGILFIDRTDPPDYLPKR